MNSLHRQNHTENEIKTLVEYVNQKTENLALETKLSDRIRLKPRDTYTFQFNPKKTGLVNVKVQARFEYTQGGVRHVGTKNAPAEVLYSPFGAKENTPHVREPLSKPKNIRIGEERAGRDTVLIKVTNTDGYDWDVTASVN